MANTLWHIDWGDGDTYFIVAPDKETAISRMPDGQGMVNHVVKLDHIYQCIFKAGAKEARARAVAIVDHYMANGYYEAPWDDILVRSLSGDVEFIWQQIKQALSEG